MSVTLLDIAKRLDPNGKISAIAELLTKTNDILTDMPFKEGNLPTGHRVTIRTGLPEVFFRTYNKGVPVSKSATSQFDEQCGMLEARCEIDKDLAELNGNTAEFRLSEATAFIEAMNQRMAKTLFYGDASVSPEEYTGLSIRYSDINAPNGTNIIKAGGTGTGNTSVWLVSWNENTVFGIYPKGSKAGLVHEDLGIIDAFDSAGNRYRAYADRWQWKCGLALRDWRYVVRVANIKITDLVSGAGTQASTAATFLPKLLAKAFHKIPSPNLGKLVFYCNRTVASNLTLLAMDKTSNVLTIEQGLNQFGNNILNLKYLGIPVRICDEISNDETAV